MKFLAKIAPAAALICMASAISAGSLTFERTTTVALQNVYPVFIACTVPIGSCNAGSPLPLIHIENEGPAPVLTNDADVFQPVNTSIIFSGYVTYLALAQGSSSDVVVALQPGIAVSGNPWPFSTPESQIAADLAGGTTAEIANLQNFFLNNLTDFVQFNGPAGNFAEFSNGTIVGSLSAAETLAPEPSTMALIGLTIGGLSFFHGFRSKHLNSR